MRERAGIQLSGDFRAFVAAWNSRSRRKIESGLIGLYRDDPDYSRLRDLFASFDKEHVLGWTEWIRVEYTQRELESFELLLLHVAGEAGKGGNSLARVYEENPVCQVCGRIEHLQTRDLVLNFAQVEVDREEIGYFRHDFCITDFGEIVVSDKVRAVLVDTQVPGVGLRSVESVSRHRGPKRDYYQLVVEPEIGPMIEPSPIRREALCEGCCQYKRVLQTALPGRKGSEFYFRRSSYLGSWVAQTHDRFGRVPEFVSRVVISHSFYRLLKVNKITGFWVQPAHLVD